MTCNFTRSALALTLVLALAGCGGKADFPVSGTVLGLSYDGLVLTTNGMDLPVAKGSTTFSFPKALSYGEVYAVTVPALGQPQHQTCQVINGSDTAGRLASINVSVICALNQHAVGGIIREQAPDGTFRALTTDGLTLTNGSNSGVITAKAGTTSFTFGVLVPYGISYGVTVLTQPAGATCTVAPNGTGIMGDNAIADIDVKCVANK